MKRSESASEIVNPRQLQSIWFKRPFLNGSDTFTESFTKDKDTLRDLGNKQGQVFGQDPAIEALATAIKLSRSGLGDEDKPIGSSFTGPTGVGKTEVAAALGS